MRAYSSLLATLVLCAATARAGTTESGVSYLLAQQQPDGSVASATEDPVLATAETVLSLRALGFSGGTELNDAQFFLATQPRALETERERLRLTALASSAWVIADPGSDTHAGGFVEPDALHLALGIDALAPRGTFPSAEDAIRGHSLAAMALPDGCYAFADNGPSAELTSRALIALRAAGFTPTLLAAATRTASCLMALQQADGGFGSASATGLAIVALAHRGDAVTSVAAAKQWLGASQRADGSWEGSVRATALALRGLQADAPDWRVTGDAVGRPAVTVRDPQPLQGETTAVLLTVENSAAQAAPASKVRVSAVRAGLSIIVGEAELAALPPGQRLDVTVPVETAQLAGLWTLEARVDPLDAVRELDEFNNSAVTRIDVRVERDLAVASGGIHFEELAANLQRVTIDVRNTGVAVQQPFKVQLLKGTAHSGVSIGEATVAALAANSRVEVALEWDSTSASGPTVLTAIVDPDDVVTEAVESNNTAFRYFFPGTTGSTDLAVTDLRRATDQILFAGDSFRLVANVKNLGCLHIEGGLLGRVRPHQGELSPREDGPSGIRQRNRDLELRLPRWRTSRTATSNR